MSMSNHMKYVPKSECTSFKLYPRRVPTGESGFVAIANWDDPSHGFFCEIPMMCWLASHFSF